MLVAVRAFGVRGLVKLLNPTVFGGLEFI